MTDTDGGDSEVVGGSSDLLLPPALEGRIGLRGIREDVDALEVSEGSLIELVSPFDSNSTLDLPLSARRMTFNRPRMISSMTMIGTDC